MNVAGNLFEIVWCRKVFATLVQDKCWTTWFQRKDLIGLWGAVCKNIISDRFSTKTAISGRDSYLCMQRCYLWQR